MKCGELLNMIGGVPQGSQLEPILFNFYLNDMFRLNLHGELQLFADYAALKFEASEPHEFFRLMKEDLNTLKKWYSKNVLPVFTNKQTNERNNSSCIY